ncbi:hypothetical protein [Sphaerospermopsis sp. LEGE 00249]|uniref:hypothetical protein n=1 Tax=Sphaerospermopsis sp. LEGE 00249 TaxID=1380707 RepID=UPI00351C2B59
MRDFLVLLRLFCQNWDAAKNYVYLWANYSLENKQNPEKRRLFKEKLAESLRITKSAPERLQVWFWDESAFSLRVIKRKIY